MNNGKQLGRQLLMHRLAFLFILLIAFAAQATGADSLEAERAFATAGKSFEDKYFERAETEFGEFVAKYPQSPRVPEVILLRGQSRFQLKNYEAVVDLLTSRVDIAGELADQYRYWIAEAQFHRQNFFAASEAYAGLLGAHPISPLRLRASYGEAFSQFKLSNLQRTVDLLKDPAGAFQRAAQRSTNETDVVRGRLLLGDALFAQKNYGAVEEALSNWVNLNLSSEVDWQREYLLANSQLADGRSEAALTRVANLVSLATAATNPVLHATSLMFQAAIQESKRPEAAIQTYEQITQIKDVAAGQSRQAILKIVALTAAQNRLTNALDRLKEFVAQNSQDPASDLIRLTLGDLHLKRYYALTDKVPRAGVQTNFVVITNTLYEAKTNFDFVINVLTNSSLVGKAYLNRGWCCWEEAKFTEGADKIVEGQRAFQAAAGRLPVSEDQAVARFKWADCQLQQRDYTNAIKNYRLLIESYSDVAQVKTNLFDQALDHILRASIEVGDLHGANDAMEKNLEWFPTSSLSQQGVLSYSHALFGRGEAFKARSALSRFQSRFPNSPLLPEIELAIAGSYVQEANWPSAISEFDQWVLRYTNHTARPQAEFDRAWAYFQSGKETNAFSIFTNYVTGFSSSPLAPLAQYWVADYHYRRQAYDIAELNYQHKILLQNTNLMSRDLGYQAQLMASKAALLRQRYAETRGYLTNLINSLRSDTNSSPSLLSEVFFIWGDVCLEEPAASSTNNLAKFGEAINIFGRVFQFSATNRLEALARGKIANCHLQLAVQDPKRYDQATNEYYKIITPPLADVADITTRSQAAVGLGEVLERQAEQKTITRQQQQQLLETALNHYLDVFFEKNVIATRGERPDPFWLKKAGLEAGRLAERLLRADEAKKTYERLMKQMPSLRPVLEKRIEGLKQPDTK